MRQVVAVSAPRRQGGLNRVNGTGHNNGQGTRRNDVKRGLRNGVAPYIPAAFCRDAGSAGHGATEAARPERSLQARGFASGMEARQWAETAPLAPFTTDPAPPEGRPEKA